MLLDHREQAGDLFLIVVGEARVYVRLDTDPPVVDGGALVEPCSR
ncbi:MAG: hypothetical protein ACRDL8_06085 [Solirubrobacteraceae bacterium]